MADASPEPTAAGSGPTPLEDDRLDQIAWGRIRLNPADVCSVHLTTWPCTSMVTLISGETVCCPGPVLKL